MAWGDRSDRRRWVSFTWFYAMRGARGDYFMTGDWKFLLQRSALVEGKKNDPGGQSVIVVLLDTSLKYRMNRV